MKITFSCDPHIIDAIPHPVKAIRAAPNYYKDAKLQLDSNPQNSTVKRCVPFLEALSAGFIIPLWCDVFVTAKDGQININFPSNFPQRQTLERHSIEQIPNHPLAGEPYGELVLKLVNPWVVETSPGVSCLFTSPLNHLETRLKIFDGIVDTDRYYSTVHFPFLWTGGDGDFHIKKGTPIVHVIPFRREEAKMSVTNVNADRKSATDAKTGTRLVHKYRTEFWHRTAKEKPGLLKGFKFWK